jgi:hypothetical protein
VELSTAAGTGSATWTDFSDWLSVVEPPPLTRIKGEQAVFGEDIHVTGVGKRNPTEIRIRGVYVDSTATASNPFLYLWNAYTTACGGPMALRWSPFGCSTAHTMFATATATGHDSEIVSITPPGGDASDGAPLMWEAVIRSSELYHATWA